MMLSSLLLLIMMMSWTLSLLLLCQWNVFVVGDGIDSAAVVVSIYGCCSCSQTCCDRHARVRPIHPCSTTVCVALIGRALSSISREFGHYSLGMFLDVKCRCDEDLRAVFTTCLALDRDRADKRADCRADTADAALPCTVKVKHHHHHNQHHHHYHRIQEQQ